MTATSLVSFQAGWWPPARSMMLNRRIPSASPGARASPVRKPSSSGPRWPIAAVIARTRDSASALRDAKATPHIPHTLLFNPRRGEESSAATNGALPQMEARDTQSFVRIPRKQRPQHQKEQCRRCGQYKIEVRFALQEQAPVDRFVPSRVNALQQTPQMQPFERQPRQPHMRELVVSILTRIVRDGADGFGKQPRIPQIAARQIAAPGILHDDPVGGIDNDPALI